ncbi:tumor necrosis factor receptor superfamily member 1A [Brienomyrus brachyistius]|uniref:tumor necrosis factor receptor superfamily member 1A n=1 Tax=Brienomyrus brachyistius TaxID=42636 RepID=UPI0020B24E1C|nr:tumor necrosis factor receptor superfamily member 1A [Brienomyrus brachyistius]
MDGKQENSWFKKIFTVFIIIVVTLAAPARPSPELLHEESGEEFCPEDEYRSRKGHCCNKCHAGFRLEQECESSHLKSICKPCPKDYYMENSNNAKNCFRCNTCKSNERMQSECKPKENRKCVCNDGYFKQSISKFTWQCLKCTTCGEGEEQRIPCSGSTNRECDCKEKFYRNSNKICEECKKCNSDQKCNHLCRKSDTDWQLAFVVVIAVMSVLILITVYMFIQKRRSCHKQEIVVSPVSSDSETSKNLLSYVSEDEKTVKDPALIPLPKHEPPVWQDPSGQEELPDCIPRVFKTCHFIYFLLQHVPASRFKELVRSLGVSERDIEWAERDNHTCKEAQFQMLKVWCDSSRGDEVETLSKARLLEMTETLRGMGLMAGAEAIEANFQIL